MVSAEFAAFEVFFNRNRHATHDGFAVLNSTHALGNAAGVKDIFCGDVEADGNTPAATLMASVTSDFVILGVHGMTSLIYLMIYYSMGISKSQVLFLDVKHLIPFKGKNWVSPSFPP